MADYSNFYGDISAGSGNGALSRDPTFTPDFLSRHQQKLIYGSDCPCATGVGPTCVGATKQRLLNDLAPSRAVLENVLYKNARRIFRLPAAHLA